MITRRLFEPENSVIHMPLESAQRTRQSDGMPVESEVMDAKPNPESACRVLDTDSLVESTRRFVSGM